MSYGTLQIGVTGPSERIGGSSPYHIDTKFSSSLSIDEVRDRFDALATRYGQDGRKIEFSNEGVAGEIYSMDLSPEKRTALLQRAANSHAQRPGWYSFDYYAPNVDETRWDGSAEGAPIYVVGGEGLSVEGHTGGAYGNFGVVVDKNGNVISKSGHGDNSHAVFGGGTITLGGPKETPITPPAVTPVVGGDADTQDVSTPAVSPPTQTPQQEAVERVQNYAEMSKAEINAAYDKMRAEDPNKAAIEGMKMHKAFFGKS